MQTIWKYKIEPDFVNQVYRMPKGAIVLSVGADAHNNLCFWAKVDTAAEYEDHLMACVGTGWEMDHIFNAKDSYACFIGTIRRDEYMYHVIDLGGRPDKRENELHPSAPNSEVGA